MRIYYEFALIIFFTISQTHGVGFHGFTYKGLDEPIIHNKDLLEKVKERWIIQPLDHFNNRDNRTWSMRYYKNIEFSNETGPIFIMLGGEWAISEGYLLSGFMYEIASRYGATMYYTEHRYYGKSRPTRNLSEKELQYLNVDQALADIAYFIKTVKNESKVIVFGGSYAGNMAAWARIKYPHLIQGALASSAPVHAKANFHEYLEVVTRSLQAYNVSCVTNIEEAFEEVEDLLKNPNGADKLKEIFHLCSSPDLKSQSEVGYFITACVEQFSAAVQYNRETSPGKSDISRVCNTMSESLEPPIRRLASLLNKSAKCLDISYKNYLHAMRDNSWSDRKFSRQWTYQTCNEYGYYQTSDSSKSPFGSWLPLEFFIHLCEDLFGESYNNDFLSARIERTNLMYGGWNPDVSHLIFTNGDIDPWHSLSVLTNLSESSHAFLIKGASHCTDLQPASYSPNPDLREKQRQILDIMGSWLRKS